MYSLTADQLTSIASLAKAVASTSDHDTAPILGSVLVHGDVDNGRLIITATDRYVAAELSLKLRIEEDYPNEFVDDFKVGHQLFARVAPMLKSLQLRTDPMAHYRLELLAADGRVFTRISDQWDATARTIADLEPAGNFPPVGRLFPPYGEDVDDIPARIRFNLGLIAKLCGISLPGERPVTAKAAVWDFTYKRSTSSDKAGPVIATRHLDQDTIRVLIQPNNMLR